MYHKHIRGRRYSGRPSLYSVELFTLTAWGLAGRSTRFLGRENHQKKHDDEPHHNTQNVCPALVPHPHHLLSEAADRRFYVTTPYLYYTTLKKGTQDVAGPARVPGFFSEISC